MVLILAVAFALFLAYANGANDNFKGVATLLGSGTTRYRRALIWATVTTAMGSLTAVVLARGLLAAFSGKGLVPSSVVEDPAFPLAVGLAAGTTVLLAARLGFPISTTHALIGGLIGAGLVASPEGIRLGQLGSKFLLPLLLSPILAVVVTLMIYPPLRFLRGRLGIQQETCVCIGNEIVARVPGTPGLTQAMAAVPQLSVHAADEATCRVRYQGAVLGISARPLLDGLHFLSAGAVSFARGLNDTPKIASLLLIAGALDPTTAIVMVGIAIALGGLLGARRVAHTMAHRVTDMNPGQGFSANLVTSALVIGASHLGMPVSTTHVSCGALFGIGAATGGGRWNTIGRILLAWVITLPLAALLSVGFFLALNAAL